LPENQPSSAWSRRSRRCFKSLEGVSRREASTFLVHVWRVFGRLSLPGQTRIVSPTNPIGRFTPHSPDEPPTDPPECVRHEKPIFRTQFGPDCFKCQRSGSREGENPASAAPLLTKIGSETPQKCIARPSTAMAASLSVSASVGWAWQERAISSALAPNSMAVTASAMSSEACGPMM